MVLGALLILNICIYFAAILVLYLDLLEFHSKLIQPTLFFFCL
jgi:hypothetical protein